MKINALSMAVMALTSIGFSFNSFAQVVLNEVEDGKNIELINLGNEDVDVRDFWIYSSGITQRVGTFRPICPFDRTLLRPGELFLVQEREERANEDGEVALFDSENFDDPSSLLSYVQWGSAGHDKEALAVSAGKWTEGEFVSLMLMDGSLEYDGEGISASDWAIQGDPSICDENGTGCDLPNFPAAPFDTMVQYLCVGEEFQSLSPSFNQNVSTEFGYVLLDRDSTILAYSPNDNFFFDTAVVDTGYLFLLSWNNQIVGIETGTHIEDLIGCYVISDPPVPVVFLELNGGMLSFESVGIQDTLLCGRDTVSSQILSFSTDSDDAFDYAYVLTDTLDRILLYPDQNSFDFTSLDTGTYRVYGFSYIGNVFQNMGSDVNSVSISDDCSNISSNFLTVTKSTSELACLVSSTEEHYLQSRIDLYPNPSSNKIRIELDGLTSYQGYKLYNANGAHMASGTDETIDLKSFSNGLYFVRIHLGEHTVSKRILKQ